LGVRPASTRFSFSHANTVSPHRDYATKVFGFATFGRVYGTVACVSGLMQLSQTGLDALVHGPLQNNPLPINIMFAAVGTAVSAAMTLYIIVKGNQYRTAQADEVAAMVADERAGLLASVRETDEEFRYGSVV